MNKKLEDAIYQIRYPNSTKSIKNIVKGININDVTSLVTIDLLILDDDPNVINQLRLELAKVVKLDFKYKGIKFNINKTENKCSKTINYILIMSGKGGVGKSTFSANLAYALKRLNKIVAIIDADVYGASLPAILNVEHSFPKTTKNQKIKPFIKDDIEFISTEFFAEKDKPIIWRGTMLNQMIQNFFLHVGWNENTQYIIIDCPPGTGDIALDLRSIIPSAKVLIITTPHITAAHVAIKAGQAAIMMKHSIIGVVENMSYYINPINNEKNFIFGEGGGQIVAEKLDTKLISQIPINKPLNHHSIYNEDEPIAKIYDDIAKHLLKIYS